MAGMDVLAVSAVPSLHFNSAPAWVFVLLGAVIGIITLLLLCIERWRGKELLVWRSITPVLPEYPVQVPSSWISDGRRPPAL